MKIVTAFDSFKGSIGAPEACAAAANGIARFDPAIQTISCPLSDGGEGFAEALALAAQGAEHPVTISGPLFEQVETSIVLLDAGQTAVLESARACGLGLVSPANRSPLRTTTYGLGEMLLAAEKAGVERVVIGLGGSSTNDGGMGMMSTLGWEFLDAQGRLLPPIGASLGKVHGIKPGRTFQRMKITAACDVCNPLYGPEGAAFAYGPQKGAAPEEVELLDQGLRKYAAVSAKILGYDASDRPGAGAAGGLGFALQAFLNAEFRPGAELAIALSRLPEHLRDADLCLTGEGRTDFQTAFGKLPAAVAACCAEQNVPCVCLSGGLGEGWRSLYQHGFSAIWSISQGPNTLETAIANCADNLADAAEAVARLFSSHTK